MALAPAAAILDEAAASTPTCSMATASTPTWRMAMASTLTMSMAKATRATTSITILVLFADQYPEFRTRRWHPDPVKRQIYAMLLIRSGPDILKRGVSASVAADMGVSQRVVQRVWDDGHRLGGVNAVGNKKVKRCGRKRIEINPDDISAIPLKKRTTLQDLANELKVSKSTLHRRFKEGKFKRHTNDIKPILTLENMIARVKYCLDMLDPTSLLQHPIFRGMYNVVHIDEKWFYLTRRSQKYYLSLNEERPKRGIRNKAFIPKVMFLTAIARPRFDEHGTCTFDGKIGLPCVAISQTASAFTSRSVKYLFMEKMDGKTKFLAPCHG